MSVNSEKIFITGCTEIRHFDNFRGSLWWTFRRNGDIFVSVLWQYECSSEFEIYVMKIALAGSEFEIDILKIALDL